MEKSILIICIEEQKYGQLLAVLHKIYALEILNTEHALLKRLKHITPDLIMLQFSKKIDCLKICSNIHESHPFSSIPVLMFSLKKTQKSENEAHQVGADAFISLPFNKKTVLNKVEKLIVWKEKLIFKDLEIQKLKNRLKVKTKSLIDSQEEIIQRLSKAAEHRDPETGDHIHRMSHYCYIVAQAAGIPEKECVMLLHASPMHDVGKLGIPDKVLLNPEPLTNEEWVIMRGHASIGENILSGSHSKLIRIAKIVAGTHHEKWDGTGYPNGLKGTDIPLLGRVAALGDVFDAMTTKRVYQNPVSFEKALTYIKSQRGKHFDPDLAELLPSLLPQFIEIKKKYSN